MCDVKREMQQSQLPYMRIGDSAFLKLTDVFGFQLQCGKKSFDIMLGASVDERKKMSRPKVRRNENFLYCLKLMLTRRNYSGRKVQNLMKIGEKLECLEDGDTGDTLHCAFETF